MLKIGFWFFGLGFLAYTLSQIVEIGPRGTASAAGEPSALTPDPASEAAGQNQWRCGGQFWKTPVQGCVHRVTGKPYRLVKAGERSDPLAAPRRSFSRPPLKSAAGAPPPEALRVKQSLPVEAVPRGMTVRRFNRLAAERYRAALRWSIRRVHDDYPAKQEARLLSDMTSCMVKRTSTGLHNHQPARFFLSGCATGLKIF